MIRFPGAAILCYHAVTDVSYPSGSITSIARTDLMASLDRLRHDREVIPLMELLERQRQGRPIDGLAAVTFDDAYESVAGLLTPWMLEQEIPFTVFVTTGASRDARQFWWDRIDDIEPLVPRERWRAFEEELALPAAFRDGQPAEFGRQRPLRQYLLSAFHGRWPRQFEAALTRLESEVGARTRQRPMTLDELQRLDRDGVELGVHTVSHPVLPLLADSELTLEISDAFRELRERYRRAVPILAIPFGLFDDRTLRLAAGAGMFASLTLANRLVPAGTLSFGIPRLSMTRGAPLWKQRLRWSGAVQAARDLLRGGRVVNYPALPSATT